MQKIGLVFVSIVGQYASASTPDFYKFINAGGVDHGQWKPNAALKAQVATRLGRDAVTGKFISVEKS